MDEKDGDNSTKRVPIRDLKMEPEAEELLESAAMEPYMNLAVAMMGGKDTGPAIEELAALPLEKRYVWRVASALILETAVAVSLGQRSSSYCWR
jgi:hypothetical protein